MSNYPGIIVFAWFIPAVLQIILPLLMLVIWVTLNIPQRLAKISAVRRQTAAAERRRYPRITGDLIGAVAADSNGKTMGKVLNFSTFGICLANSSETALDSEEVISIQTKNNAAYRLLVKPKWERFHKSEKMIGAAILNTPAGWAELTVAAG